MPRVIASIEVSGKEGIEKILLPITPIAYQFQGTGAHDVQGLAGITLTKKHLPRRKLALDDELLHLPYLLRL
jgi:hypothetical protein